MKAAAFDYVKPASLDELLDLKLKYGAEATILAGGQSLIPAMHLREVKPALLLDINGLSELREIRETPHTILVGSLVRYSELAGSGAMTSYAPLLGLAIPHIASPAIRNRGTVGGSVALADPGAELPACMTALRGVVHLKSASNERQIAISEFFTGANASCINDDELVTAVEIPKLQPGYRSGFAEISRRHGGYAVCGAAAHALVQGRVISDFRLVYFAAGPTPVIAAAAMSEIEGHELNEERIEAAQAALANDITPLDNLHGSSELRHHYARVLAGEVLNQLVLEDGGRNAG